MSHKSCGPMKMQENGSMELIDQWEGREVCQGRDFGDDMTKKEKISWCPALVSSTFHSQLNFQGKPNRE